MKLSEAQTTNPLWHALRAHYTERLQQLRIENDNARLSDTATAELRGRIDECKAFLAMESPEPEISVKGM